MSDSREGWQLAPLSAVTEPVSNVSPLSQPDKEFHYVDISSIDNTANCIVATKRFKGKDAPSRAKRPIRPNDVLFSNVRTYLRNIAIVPQYLKADLCSTGFTILRPNAAIEPLYLLRYVLTEDFIGTITPTQTGTHYPATSDSAVLSQQIPLPPIAEQRRIVAKLEDLLSRVEACRERLDRIPLILKRFRQTILAAACSGRLTDDWRGIARELADQNRSNKDASPASSNHPDPPESHELPAGWNYTYIDPLLSKKRRGIKTGPFGSMLKKDEHRRNGVPVLGIENIGFLEFRGGTKIYVTPEKAKELAEYDAIAGDILISRSGTVGEVCVVPNGLGQARISTNLIRVALSTNSMLPMLFCYLLNGSPAVLAQVSDLCKGSTRVFLNQTTLRSIVLPLPPLKEQTEIVRRVEALFKVGTLLKERYQKACAQIDKLTQSILTRAFRGELVPTEAELARRDGRDYEPASVLLERIRNRDVGQVRGEGIAPHKRASHPVSSTGGARRNSVRRRRPRGSDRA